MADADTLGGHYYDGWSAALAGGRLRAVFSLPSKFGRRALEHSHHPVPLGAVL
jgi:hypothetical protein